MIFYSIILRSKLGQCPKMYDTADLLERSIEIGIETKASGFDVIFMACADVTGSLLITDDRKMYERSRESGIDTTLLRDWKSD